MLVGVSYQIILILGYSVLLGGFELGEEVRDFFGVDGNFI